MKRTTPLFGKVACIPFAVRTVDVLRTQIVEAQDIPRMRKMCKDSYLEELAKINYDDGSIQIEESGVFIQKEKIYINDLSRASPTFTTYLKTYCEKTDRTIKSKVRVCKNIEYDGNEKCQFCDKKVISKLFSSKKNDPERTPVNVCKHCKDVLAIARRILDKND